MNIVEKISDRNSFLAIEKAFNNNIHKIEIQYFSNKVASEFDITSTVDSIMEAAEENNIELDEITIHPPLDNYEIEYLMEKDINIIKRQLSVCGIIADKYKVKVNMLYHCRLDFVIYKEIYREKFKDILASIKDSRVSMLLENIVFNYDRRGCNVIAIAQDLHSDKLGVCIDTCHVDCKAAIFKKTRAEFYDIYIQDYAYKYVRQIHFAQALNNDGYVDEKTHGRMHESFDTLLSDYNLLKQKHINDVNIVTEVSEDDYEHRRDQIQEIKWLMEI